MDIENLAKAASEQLKEVLSQDIIVQQQARIDQLAATNEELEAENKNLRHMIIDQIESAGDDPEIMAASRAEWAARAKKAEAKLERASKMLPRALLAIYKDRKQEAIDVLETAIAELTGGNDD
jgi:seryl-tRNA synthetase